MYAQVLKEDMKVNLIGGEEVGLPIKHPSVICVDIGDRTDVKLYMKYDDTTGKFYNEIIEQPTSSTLREQAYHTMLIKEDDTPLILWEDKTITVDEANKIFYNYFAEKNSKAEELQTLIINAKEYIRSLYLDN